MFAGSPGPGEALWRLSDGLVSDDSRYWGAQADIGHDGFNAGPRHWQGIGIRRDALRETRWWIGAAGGVAELSASWTGLLFSLDRSQPSTPECRREKRCGCPGQTRARRLLTVGRPVLFHPMRRRHLSRSAQGKKVTTSVNLSSESCGVRGLPRSKWRAGNGGRVTARIVKFKHAFCRSGFKPLEVFARSIKIRL